MPKDASTSDLIDPRISKAITNSLHREFHEAYDNIYKNKSEAEKHVYGAMALGNQVAIGYIINAIKPMLMAVTGLVRVEFTHNWLKYLNGSTLLCAESGSGKTSALQYSEKCIKTLDTLLKDKHLQQFLPGLRLSTFQSFVIEAGTIPSLEKDLCSKTGTGNTELIPERKDFIAGSGVMFQTEAAQFIRANSANGKGCAGAFLCELLESNNTGLHKTFKSDNVASIACPLLNFNMCLQMQPIFHQSFELEGIHNANPWARLEISYEPAATRDSLIGNLVNYPNPQIVAVHGLFPMIKHFRCDYSDNTHKYYAKPFCTLRFPSDSFLMWIFAIIKKYKFTPYRVSPDGQFEWLFAPSKDRTHAALQGIHPGNDVFAVQSATRTLHEFAIATSYMANQPNRSREERTILSKMAGQVLNRIGTNHLLKAFACNITYARQTIKQTTGKDPWASDYTISKSDFNIEDFTKQSKDNDPCLQLPIITGQEDTNDLESDDEPTIEEIEQKLNTVTLDDSVVADFNKDEQNWFLQRNNLLHAIYNEDISISQDDRHSTIISHETVQRSIEEQWLSYKILTQLHQQLQAQKSSTSTSTSDPIPSEERSPLTKLKIGTLYSLLQQVIANSPEDKNKACTDNYGIHNFKASVIGLLVLLRPQQTTICPAKTEDNSLEKWMIDVKNMSWTKLKLTKNGRICEKRAISLLRLLTQLGVWKLVPAIADEPEKWIYIDQQEEAALISTDDTDNFNIIAPKIIELHQLLNYLGLSFKSIESPLAALIDAHQNEWSQMLERAPLSKQIISKQKDWISKKSVLDAYIPPTKKQTQHKKINKKHIAALNNNNNNNNNSVESGIIGISSNFNNLNNFSNANNFSNNNNNNLNHYNNNDNSSMMSEMSFGYQQQANNQQHPMFASGIQNRRQFPLAQPPLTIPYNSGQSSHPNSAPSNINQEKYRFDDFPSSQSTSDMDDDNEINMLTKALYGNRYPKYQKGNQGQRIPRNNNDNNANMQFAFNDNWDVISMNGRNRSRSHQDRRH